MLIGPNGPALSYKDQAIFQLEHASTNGDALNHTKCHCKYSKVCIQFFNSLTVALSSWDIY